jgi:hypothetical protein
MESCRSFQEARVMLLQFPTLAKLGSKLNVSCKKWTTLSYQNRRYILKYIGVHYVYNLHTKKNAILLLLLSTSLSLLSSSFDDFLFEPISIEAIDAYDFHLHNIALQSYQIKIINIFSMNDHISSTNCTMTHKPCVCVREKRREIWMRNVPKKLLAMTWWYGRSFLQSISYHKKKASFADPKRLH